MMIRKFHAGTWLLALAMLGMSAGYGRCSGNHAGGFLSWTPFSSGSFFGIGGSAERREPEAYGGQKICPVSGERLGSQRPAVPVTTSIGATQPSLLGKMFGRKATPGIVVYACCQECVAKVKSAPGEYVVKVIAERGGAPK